MTQPRPWVRFWRRRQKHQRVPQGFPSDDFGEASINKALNMQIEFAKSGKFRLSMEQSGFRPDQPRYYQCAKYGWQKFLADLEQVPARAD
jgi:hypothetical protein